MIATVPGAFAAGPYGSIQVGGWKGGAYTKDATGAFSHCAAGASYQSGIYFMVMVNSQFNWSLGFAHPSCRLTNQTIPIDLTFDGQHQFHVFGTPIAASVVEVPMPNNSALVNAFRKSQTMIAFARGQQFPFNLPATSALLPTLVNCVQQMNAKGIASAGDFTIHAAPKTAPAAVATNAGSTLKPEANQPQSAEYQVE